MKIKEEVLLNVLKKDSTKCFNRIRKDQLNVLRALIKCFK